MLGRDVLFGGHRQGKLERGKHDKSTDPTSKAGKA